MVAVVGGKAPAGNGGVGPVVLSHPGAPGLRSEVIQMKKLFQQVEIK